MDWTIFWTAAGAIGAVMAACWPMLDRMFKAKPQAAYSIEGDDWVAHKNISYDVLLRRLIGVDYVSTPGLDEKSEGKVDQWAPVFRKSSDTWGLVVYRDEPIVGYWSYFSLSNDLLDRLRAGKLHDSEITEDQIHTLEEDREHHLHVVMIARQPEYASGQKQIFALLMESLCSSLVDLDKRGVRVSRIYANAFTPEGHELCKRLGFSEVVAAEQGGIVYEAKLTDQLKNRLFRLAKRAPPRRTWTIRRWLKGIAENWMRDASHQSRPQRA